MPLFRLLPQRILASLAVGLMVCGTLGSSGCKSMQDGARQVSLGAQDLGRRMAEPFKRGGRSGDYSSRESGRGESDPFLPPPRRPEGDETSQLIPRPLSVATLGEPILDDRFSRASKPPLP
jgi:hypothetical protein